MTGKSRQRGTLLAAGTTRQDEIKVMNDGAKKFGALLRRHRGAAGMTQEDLAERSGLSVRTVRGLERGEGHGPRPDTLGYLVGALGLSGSERQLFEEAALRLGAQPAVNLGVSDALPRLGAQEYPTEPLTPLVGRGDLVREAGALLLREDVRLLTLVGPGGVGKTRVGLEVSEDLRSGYADGVISVGLEAVNDPDLVLPTIAGALGLREDAGGRPLLARLQEYLRDKDALLLLDNFEQVRTAAPLLVELLSGCPRLKALVTSRASLRVRGEQEFAVPPLETPGQASADLEAVVIGRFPAVALFVGRAGAVDPAFELTDENAPAVAEICRRLDGLPLAIELAASRVTLLPPEALLSRLAPGLDLLTGGGQDMPERQRTMRQTIAWSHELLREDERALFRRLAVFSGGCTPEAAEAVCSPMTVSAATAPERGEHFGILDGLASLVGASLLWRRIDRGDGVRVGMLGTIREYARERLAGSREEVEILRRHAAYFLDLAETAEPHLRETDNAAWLDRLEREHDNMRVALRWARESGDLETGLRLAGALRLFWWTRGYLGEGRRWTEGFLEDAARSDLPPSEAARAKASYGAGQLAYGQGDPESGVALAEVALELFRRLDDERGTAAALVELGQVLRARGDHDRAATLSEKGLALSRALDDRGSAAIALNTLGQVARRRGDRDRAVACHEEALAFFEEVGDKRGHAYTLGSLGIAVLERGQGEHALRLHEESLRLYDELRDRGGRAFALVNLGDAVRGRGDEERAASLYEEALALHRELGNERGIHRVLERLATKP